jgi:hypothetical protein
MTKPNTLLLAAPNEKKVTRVIGDTPDSIITIQIEYYRATTGIRVVLFVWNSCVVRLADGSVMVSFLLGSSIPTNKGWGNIGYSYSSQDCIFVGDALHVSRQVNKAVH